MLNIILFDYERIIACFLHVSNENLEGKIVFNYHKNNVNITNYIKKMYLCNLFLLHKISYLFF